MDQETTISELKEKVKMFCKERDWDQFHNAKELALALSVEASELLEMFIWKTPEEVDQLLANPKKREEIEDELADVFNYTLRLAGFYNIDLSQIFERKMKKNAAKYPVEKAKGTHAKYTEL